MLAAVQPTQILSDAHVVDARQLCEVDGRGVWFGRVEGSSALAAHQELRRHDGWYPVFVGAQDAEIEHYTWPRDLLEQLPAHFVHGARLSAIRREAVHASNARLEQLALAASECPGEPIEGDERATRPVPNFLYDEGQEPLWGWQWLVLLPADNIAEAYALLPDVERFAGPPLPELLAHLTRWLGVHGVDLIAADVFTITLRPRALPTPKEAMALATEMCRLSADMMLLSGYRPSRLAHRLLEAEYWELQLDT